jgi:hypothetical protein
VACRWRGAGLEMSWARCSKEQGNATWFRLLLPQSDAVSTVERGMQEAEEKQVDPSGLTCMARPRWACGEERMSCFCAGSDKNGRAPQILAQLEGLLRRPRFRSRLRIRWKRTLAPEVTACPPLASGASERAHGQVDVGAAAEPAPCHPS